MRTSEWIVIGYLVYLIAIDRARPVHPTRRPPLIAWATATAATVVLLAFAVNARPIAAIRDWMPGLYLFVGYWLSGHLFDIPDETIERRLLAVDARLFAATRLNRALAAAPRALLEYLELAYLSCYPLVPAGFAVVFLSGHRADADRFWSMVLLAEFGCYAMLPWIQTRPPRAIEPASAMDARAPWLRRVNVWILARGSIQANTVPSGHAAGAAATALAIAGAAPAAGLLTAALALSIALASVAGRYHYAVDAVSGLLVGVLGWALVATGVLPTD